MTRRRSPIQIQLFSFGALGMKYYALASVAARYVDEMALGSV
jgi:hypothetical protein